MVESKCYHGIVCYFAFSDAFWHDHRVSGQIPGWNREHLAKPGVKWIHSRYHKANWTSLGVAPGREASKTEMEWSTSG